MRLPRAMLGADFSAGIEFALDESFCHLTSEIDLQFLQDRTSAPVAIPLQPCAADRRNQMSYFAVVRNINPRSMLRFGGGDPILRRYAFDPCRHPTCI